ncbi:acylphosphatase [Candidatus Gottesmanbacteria bacterium]|nr:acylphosphatase [Candidatus Gottesmanbacteria bacterium]
MKRIRIIISGDVQGVGFRAWVVAQAQDLGCVGWVKNRDDGAVEIVAEGKHIHLEQLIKSCHSGPAMASVKALIVNWGKSTNEFVIFEVVY